MDRQTTKRLRYYLRLQYPNEVIAYINGYKGRYPDLPGCECFASTLQQLYIRLERTRRTWITTQVQRFQHAPKPNSHLDRMSYNHPKVTCISPQKVFEQSFAASAV